MEAPPGSGSLGDDSLSCHHIYLDTGVFFESQSDTLDRQLFFNNIGYIGSMSVPAAWFLFALRYAGDGKLAACWKRSLFGIFPLIIICLVWTNNWHHLMWSNEHLVISGPFTVTAKTYGPLFWIAITHNYALVITGAIVMLLRLFIGTPLYKKQAISFLIAVGLPPWPGISSMCLIWYRCRAKT